MLNNFHFLFVCYIFCLLLSGINMNFSLASDNRPSWVRTAEDEARVVTPDYSVEEAIRLIIRPTGVRTFNPHIRQEQIERTIQLILPQDMHMVTGRVYFHPAMGSAVLDDDVCRPRSNPNSIYFSTVSSSSNVLALIEVFYHLSGEEEIQRASFSINPSEEGERDFYPSTLGEHKSTVQETFNNLLPMYNRDNDLYERVTPVLRWLGDRT